MGAIPSSRNELPDPAQDTLTAANEASQRNEPAGSDRQRGLSWAQRLKRTFAVGIQTCRHAAAGGVSSSASKRPRWLAFASCKFLFIEMADVNVPAIA